MSTVTSPTLVAPCDLRNALTVSCSAGIFSASTSFNDLSAEMLRTNDVNAGKVFYLTKTKNKFEMGKLNV